MSAAPAKSTKKPGRAKKAARPVYLTVRKMVVPETGEEIGALVPSTRWDQKALHDRKLKVGTQVRGLLQKPRNPKLNGLGHALCAFIAERVPGFEDGDGHAALKKLQRECGAYCEAYEIDLGPLGIVQASQARSIAFDDMEEDEFLDLLKQIARHIAATYLKDMTPEEVEAAVEMMVQE